MSRKAYFNPRTREGCDSIAELKLRAYAVISIHAPVKGATERPQRPRLEMRNFNPRTREGCDSGVSALAGIPGIYFNPRTREGCDMTMCR